MVAGPIPLTLRRPSIERKGPSESRLATIRFASAGPTRGRVSISGADAVSRSTKAASAARTPFGAFRPRLSALLGALPATVSMNGEPMSIRGDGGGKPRRLLHGTDATPPTTFTPVSRPRGATKRGPRGFAPVPPDFTLLFPFEFRSPFDATAALFAAKA